jgi:hypothetical protein
MCRVDEGGISFASQRVIMNTIKCRVFTSLTLGFAAVLGVSAQNPPAAKSSVAVTGCVTRQQRDGSLSRKAAAPTPSPSTAPMDANNPEPLDTFVLTDAKPVKQGAASPKPTAPGVYVPDRTTYGLRGLEAQLAKHAGHRVELQGTLLPPVAAATRSSAATPAEGIDRIQVASIKMIGTDCSPAKKQD